MSRDEMRDIERERSCMLVHTLAPRLRQRLRLRLGLGCAILFKPNTQSNIQTVKIQTNENPSSTCELSPIAAKWSPFGGKPGQKL